MITLQRYKIPFIHLSGYEKYNGTRCAVGEFYMKDSNLTVTIWLDAKKGTCLKIINSGYDSFGKPFEYIEEYKATYGVVTDEDVKKPDLTGYTLIEYSDDTTTDTNEITFPDNDPLT